MNVMTQKGRTMLSIASNDERTVYRYYQLVDGVWVPYKRQVFRNNVISIDAACQFASRQWLWR